MSNYYEINEVDYRNLIKDLSLFGVSQVVGEYSALGMFSLEEDYLEFEGKFNSEDYVEFKRNLNEDRFYWQMHKNVLRQKNSISEVMMDIAERADLELNKKHNLDEKRYRRKIEITLNVKKDHPNISIELITPTLIIYDLKGLSFSNLIEKKSKEIKNARV
jgi:hypothetical protein